MIETHKEKRSEFNIVILISLFIVSLSLFTYQVTLTRLYSAILSYHYVFLTTSFAVLGLGIGSIAAYLDRVRLNKLFEENSIQSEKMMKQINKGAFILSCVFVVVFVLIYVQPFIDSILVYMILGIFPFVISGYLYSILFKFWAKISGKLYFADLLGAGAGSVIIVFALDNLGMFQTVLLICVMPTAIPIISSIVYKNLNAIGFMLPILLSVAMFLPNQTVRAIETNFYALLNNSGKAFGEMQRSGLAPEIIFSRWDSFARTDLIKLGHVPELKIITIDGTANAPMYVFDGNIDSLNVFKGNTGYIPFTIVERPKTLVIGAGGGRGVLYALASGSENIVAVEINPASIEAARMFGDFNGHIFDRPEVRTYIQDGRNFVRATDEKFDLIFLSLVVTNTTQGVGFALSENYIHTVQAMEDYLARLNYNGAVAFVAHDQSSLQRLTTTAIQALNNTGIAINYTPNHMASFYQLADMGAGRAQIVAPVIIIRNEPFSEEESLRLKDEILSIGATPNYIPHFHEHGPLGQIRTGQISFEQFIDSIEIRAEPVTDNSPYFFNFDRGVPDVLIQILLVGLIGSVLLFAPFAVKKRNLKPTIYFGLLGMGFMMIQIPLIQKFILYLGHPTLAFSYILAAMLIGCGVGGFLSGRKRFSKIRLFIYLPPVLASVMCVAILLSLGFVFDQTADAYIAYRVIIAAIIAASAGFFMGMPFPRGLSILGQSERRDIIPVMWGINGTMSVVGSVVSIILSMTFGFNIALLVGAVIYLGIGLFREI